MSSDYCDISWFRIWVVQRDVLFGADVEHVFLRGGSCLSVLADVLCWNLVFHDAEPFHSGCDLRKKLFLLTTIRLYILNHVKSIVRVNHIEDGRSVFVNASAQILGGAKAKTSRQIVIQLYLTHVYQLRLLHLINV